MKRPRVVHVVVAGEIGGAETMLCALASRSESGADHTVALMTPHGGLGALLRGAGLRVVDRGPVREGPLPFLWRSLGPADVAWLGRVLDREGATAVHVHTFASHVVGTRAAARRELPVLRTEHSTRAFDDPSCWPFSRWSLARAAMSVSVSEHVRARAAARAPWAAAKMRVVRNGVDTNRWQPRERPAGAPFTFALVGRLEKRKGVDLALDALAAAPDARLVVVGEGAERAALERHAVLRGVGDRVRFAGHVADPRDVLAGAGAVLCSSRAEGLGIALLEAMAMGLPVIGFAVGGVPEIVDDGQTGLLVAAGDVDALACRMRDAMLGAEPLEAMGRRARARVVERFSVQAMCAGYADAYASLRR